MLSKDDLVKTKRRVLAQIVLCDGCCCGRVEKGKPGLPVQRIKSAWKAERLNKVIHLTVSGCLGPCDVANVAQIVTPDQTRWFGRLDRESYYDDILAWARSCRSASAVLRIPASLSVLEFDGYVSPAEIKAP